MINNYEDREYGKDRNSQHPIDVGSLVALIYRASTLSTNYTHSFGVGSFPLQSQQWDPI